MDGDILLNGATLPEKQGNNLSTHSYIKAATSENTRKAYQADIRHFMHWGGILPTDIATIQKYLENNANKLNSRTLVRRLTAIRQWHISQGFFDPTAHPMVSKLLTGIKNTHGKPKVKAPPLTIENILKIVRCLEAEKNSNGYRNNALLQLGYFGAFRRSELITIEWKHITYHPEGIEIMLPRSKTDQAGDGQVCAIPYGNHELCPIKALKIWQGQLAAKVGPIFCQLPIKNSNCVAIKAAQVNYIIKAAAKKAGVDNSEKYSSHSLRRGFATEASKKGVPFGAIMRQGRWRHEATVLGYIEEGSRFNSNAVDIMLNKSE